MRTHKVSKLTSMFRYGRFDDLDRFKGWQEDDLQPLWDSTERPSDAMAWRVRQVLTMLKPTHAEVLEDKYFLGMSDTQIAEKRGTTDRAVRGLTLRAKQAFVARFAEHAAGLDVAEGDH